MNSSQDKSLDAIETESPYLNPIGGTLQNFELDMEANSYNRHIVNWGRCYPLCLDKKNNQASIVIGPHWPLSIITLFFFMGVSSGIIFLNYHRKASEITIRVCYGIQFLQILTFLIVFLKNPGVANLNTTQILANSSNEKNKPWYCKKCKILQKKGTFHCADCQICIIEMDHHCPWTGKCIGKGNYNEFYLFIVSTMIYITYNLIDVLSLVEI